jgi:hypothetical protein
MAFRNLFGRRPLPPAPPMPPPAKSAPVALAPASAYQPVPVNSADPVDAEVLRLWIAYQRQSRAPSWPSFLAELSEANAGLNERVTRAKSDIAHCRRVGVFVP